MGQGSRVNLHKYLKKKKQPQRFFLPIFTVFLLLPAATFRNLNALFFFFPLFFFPLFGLQKKDFLRREQ